MKLALVLFLATAGTLRVHSVPIDNESSSSLLSSGLEKDLKDFLALVPVQEIQEIVLEYLSNDADFQETLEYLVSKEFTSLVLEIEAMQDVKVFLKYLHDSGLDVYNLLNQLHDFLGLEHYVPITQQIERKITGGLPGLIKDIEAILPLEKIEALYQEKLKSSKEFADLIKHIKSSEFQNTVNTVFKNPKVQDLINKAKAKGVDVKAILDLVTKILGIKFPGLTRFTNLGMQQDIDDFLALIPKQKIQDLVLEYLATDHDFQVTMDYILSNEFRSLVLDIEAIPEVRMFIQYLNNVGLDVYNGLKILHDFLGIDHYVPFSHNYGLLRITGGLPGLIEDIKAILPIHDIQELYEEKLKTSQAFRSLVEQLKSEKSQKIIDIVWANEKFIKLINRAEAKGVDVKAILQLLTDILGIKFPSSRHTRSITMGLNDDLQEFLSLVPKKEIEELVMEYLASDADFQETLEYLLSNDFKNLVLEIEAIKDVKLFIKYLSDAGLDVYTLLNQLHDFLGLDHITPMEFDDSYETLYQVYKITGGLKGLIEDVKAILPLDKIQELYKKKLDTSSEFAALIKKLGSPDFQKIVDLVWTNPKLQELINKAQAKGVDVKAILKLITEILGIKFPSSRAITMGLNDDLKEFLALVPQKEIEALVMEYLTSDADFQEAVEYMLSNDFKNLVLEIEAIKDVKLFIKYLSDAGLDVYTLLNQLHDFLGLDHITPFEFSELDYVSFRITGGLPGLIEDVKAILPLDKVEALYKKKLETSPEFAALIKKISSPEFQKIVDTVWANPRLQELINKAQDKGVDVKAILKLITEILGIHFPSSRSITMGLNDDLKEFLALVPQKEIEALVMEYLSSDADFQEVLEYVLSNDFKNLVLEIEAIKDVKLFIKYLNDVGLDVYTLLNQFHDFLGLDHITPSIVVYGAYKITGGLPGLIEDVKALLPVDKIEALYKKKLETSPEFAALIKKISSTEFQKIVDTVWANPRLQELINKAQAKGVDVKAILKLITEILGIHFPSSRSVTMGLNDDLKEFLALVPQKEIEALVMEYLTSDADFQEVLEYVLSNDFKNLVLEIEAIKDVKLFIKYLNDAGLDVYTLLNQLHDFLGLDHMTPFEFEDLEYITFRITGGLPGLIEDVKALLPVDKIEALYKKKLATSAEFAALIKKISSPEFQKIVDTVWANPRLQELVNKAQAKGVDVKAILKLITEILGIKFPSSRAITMGLNDDLKEFLALVPQKEIEALVMEYLTADADFQEAVEYMLSNDFKNLVLEIEAIKDVKLFIKYLSDAGLDVYTLLNQLHDFLGLDHMTPFEFEDSEYITFRITGGLPGLIEDVKAILPLDKIQTLYKKKLETSTEFAALIKKISSPEFQKIINTVWANPKLQELINKAQSKGVDVKAILQLITEILGIHFPGTQYKSPMFIRYEGNLNDDLNDLMDLIPMNDVLEVALEYVAVDKDFQIFLEYLQSDYIGALVTDIENINGVPAFLQYLHKSGLDVYTFLNKLHAIWSLDPIKPNTSIFNFLDIIGGLPGFIKDILSVLPVEKIKKLYNHKLEKSEALKDLLKQIQTPEFQIMVDTLMINERLNDLMTKVEEKGVDVNAILKAISQLLGIKLPSRPKSTIFVNDALMKDLNDFVKLVPNKKIAKIVINYALIDRDFKKVIKYMRSNDFHTLIRNVEATQEMKQFLEYLNNIGLDVYKWMKVVHKIIGMEKLEMKFNFNSEEKISGGINGLIKDIKAVLPVKELNALYEKKLKDSPVFVEFVERLRSNELQNLINALAKIGEVERVLTKLETMGVDINNIFQLLSDFFGIKFPPRPSNLI